MRFLNRQLSLPVSTMSQWWVSAAGLKEAARDRRPHSNLVYFANDLQLLYEHQ